MEDGGPDSGGGCISTLRNDFKIRMAALNSKQLMFCPASSTLQHPPVDLSLQVAPQPSKDASVLMARLKGGGVMSLLLQVCRVDDTHHLRSSRDG